MGAKKRLEKKARWEHRVNHNFESLSIVWNRFKSFSIVSARQVIYFWRNRDVKSAEDPEKNEEVKHSIILPISCACMCFVCAFLRAGTYSREMAPNCLGDGG